MLKNSDCRLLKKIPEARRKQSPRGHGMPCPYHPRWSDTIGRNDEAYGSFFGSVLVHVAPRVIRAAHEWTGFDVAKAHLVCFGLEVLKLFRRHVAFDFELAV
jgi:hypothetical protein